jgi:2-amino-4-hydroxy-6-hydroxymethyldihydropteridine diphosphokinase
LGSNLGDREDNLERAIADLESTSGIEVIARSSVYESVPMGYRDQPDFLNMALKVKTTLAPEDLMARCMQVEESMGRVRDVRWGPRVIDIDLLLFEQEVSNGEQLKLPHPEMTRRAFVIIPLLEIDPDLAMPDGVPLRRYLQFLESEELSGIRRWGEKI